MRKIQIKVKAGSRKPGIEEIDKDQYIIRVRARAQEGKANKEALERLAAHLKHPGSLLEILRGHTNPNKLVLVHEK